MLREYLQLSDQIETTLVVDAMKRGGENFLCNE